MIDVSRCVGVNQQMEETRIRELDGLRAVAVLLVLIWHYFGVPDGKDYWLWKALHVGRFGVDLFFVLSGYLITNILLKNRNSSTYFSSFYGRRALRIWPIYYLMCAASFVGWLFEVSPTLFDTNGVPGWTYLLGLQNFGIAVAQNNGVYWLGGTWSLAIEEQFYLLFPVLVRKIPPERLFGILLAPIIVCPIGRLIDSTLHDAYGWYVLPQFRADALAIGALVAWWRLYRKPSETVTLAVNNWFNRALLCLPLLWLLGTGRWSVAFSHTIAGAFFGLALFLVLDNRGAGRLKILRGPVAVFFAKTSYAAYMIHHVVIYILFAVTGEARTLTTLSGIAMTGIAVVLTFAICALSYRYFEMPLIAFGHRRFSFGKPSVGTPSNLIVGETDRPAGCVEFFRGRMARSEQSVNPGSQAGLADNGQALT
jgi:peptidoglycan/LPS O-acetylase OafA/YrhL